MREEVLGKIVTWLTKLDNTAAQLEEKTRELKLKSHESLQKTIIEVIKRRIAFYYERKNDLTIEDKLQDLGEIVELHDRLDNPDRSVIEEIIKIRADIDNN